LDTLEKTLFLYELGLADRNLIKKKCSERIQWGEHEPMLYALADSDDMNDTEFGELAGSVFATLTSKQTTPSGLGSVLYGFLGSGKVMQSDAYRLFELILEKAEESKNDSEEESYFIGNLIIFATAQDFLHPIDMTRLLNKAWPQAGYPGNWTHLVGRESDIEDLKFSVQESRNAVNKDTNESVIEENINNAIVQIKNDAIKFVEKITFGS
jgi:hypothetical protein